ncbi:MAG: low temperature requirement protein [Microbacteriaceae bacterium]|nr:low temperature requirement protein [Microbacteriaceae bacterium]
MPHLPSFRVRTRMSGRDADEQHRVSSPLELLFDLTFVVAVAQVASQLAHSVTGGHVLEAGLGAYLMVFFAIWWAWMNFTWFASAYDTDDVFYRILTMVQMAGVLVLAAGVPAAFADQQYLGVTLGYLVMRIGLVAQWIRAGIENPDGRTTAFRYAAGITLVQVGWVLRLLLPPELGVWSFIVLALLDVSVPIWAERTGSTSWHPHHIAERYGLFTIILLGESVSAAIVAVQGSVTEDGVSLPLVVIAVAGLVLLFALWWLYFLQPAGEGLVNHRDRSFIWGYGHYFLFAATAAIGAALEVAVEAGTGHSEIAQVLAGYALAVPVAVFFVLLFVLHVPIVDVVVTHPVPIAAATAVVLLLPLAAPGIGVAMVVVLIALVAALLTALSIAGITRRRAGQSGGENAG